MNVIIAHLQTNYYAFWSLCRFIIKNNAGNQGHHTNSSKRMYFLNWNSETHVNVINLFFIPYKIECTYIYLPDSS